MGYSAILGARNGKTVGCSYDHYAFGSRTGSGGVTVATNEDTGSVSLVSGYGNETLRNSVINSAESVTAQGGSSGFCPASIWSGNTNFRLTNEAVEDTSTGVFEFQDMVDALAALVLILIILAVGIRLAKKSVNTVTEETSEDDNVEWYEGADGKEYWRLKRKFYRGH